MKFGIISLTAVLLLVFGAGISYAEQKTLCEMGCDMQYETCGKCPNSITNMYQMCDSSELWDDSTAVVAVGRGVTPKVWDCDLVNDFYRGNIEKESGYFVGECTCVKDFRECLAKVNIDYRICLSSKDDSTPYSIVAAQCGASADDAGRSCGMGAGTCYNSFMPNFCGTQKDSCLVACKNREQPAPPEPEIGQTKSILESGNGGNYSNFTAVPEPYIPPSGTSTWPCPALLVSLALAGFAFASKS